MIAASYVFYAWWDWRFVLLLAGVSAIASSARSPSAQTRTPRARLVVNGIAVTLLRSRSRSSSTTVSSPST